MHADDPAREYVPAGHCSAVGDTDPMGHTYPAEHRPLQAADASPPVTPYVPAEQLAHAAAPARLYCPALQGMPTADPAPQWLPAGHGNPVGEKLPAGQ